MKKNKQKLNRSALIYMIIFLLAIIGVLAFLFGNEIRQSFSSKTVSKGVVIKKNKFNDDPHIGDITGSVTKTMYRVSIELESNAGIVTTDKEGIYNKSETNKTYFVLWRTVDNEILDIAKDKASLNYDAKDSFSYQELLLTGGGVLVVIIFMFSRIIRGKR